ncbi:hypothetical protein ACN6K4_006063 [Streptomyces hayashii]|uniref:hypothetical protein n=1 Tax=Streptomyces hayashii TaxID=2839966 RepID=UPI00403D4567
MSAHPPLALAAAAVVAAVLLLRWGATPRPGPVRRRCGDGEPRSAERGSGGAARSGSGGAARSGSGSAPVRSRAVPDRSEPVTATPSSASGSEVGFNEALEAEGIRAYETDLAEPVAPRPVVPRPVAAGAEGVRAGGLGRPVVPDVGGRGALCDAERHLSAHWERLRPLYPHVSDTAAPRHHDR